MLGIPSSGRLQNNNACQKTENFDNLLNLTSASPQETTSENESVDDSAHHSVSTAIFDWGFLYPLTGKVGGTKSEMGVQEFCTPILINSFIKMKN